MKKSVSTQVDVTLFLDQPIKAFLGLKRRQWPKRAAFRAIARECLEGMGINNIIGVNCFLKTGRGYTPFGDPSVVNLYIRLNGANSIEIIT